MSLFSDWKLTPDTVPQVTFVDGLPESGSNLFIFILNGTESGSVEESWNAPYQSIEFSLESPSSGCSKSKSAQSSFGSRSQRQHRIRLMGCEGSRYGMFKIWMDPPKLRSKSTYENEITERQGQAIEEIVDGFKVYLDNELVCSQDDEHFFNIDGQELLR